MTNEELAIQYQNAGEKERAGILNELWERNSGILSLYSIRFYNANKAACERAGQELDDLMQIAFFALRDAVEAFNIESGYKLTTFLRYPLQNQFNEALGRQTSKKRPLNFCASLDSPIGEEEDSSTLGDFQEDKYAFAMFEQADEAIFNIQLRKALDSSLSTIPERESRVIQSIYFNNATRSEIADDMGCVLSNVCAIERHGLRHLRQHKSLIHLKPFHDEIIEHNAWHGTGFSSWKNTGASSVERTTEKAEEYMLKFLEARSKKDN